MAQQTFGRTRADNTVYKDIVDTGFFFTKRFYDQKKPVFMKYATECKDVVIRNDELDARAYSIQYLHDSKIQPMRFYEDRPADIIIPMTFENGK